MQMMDLNADLGEAESPKGQKIEAEILRFVTSANIACGGHAGSVESMTRTVKLCRARGVTMGAHPAWPDKENFGRKNWMLGQDISGKNLRKNLMQQIVTLCEISAQNQTAISYVKPHGSLYNQAVFSKELASEIAGVTATLDPSLALMGAPGSQLQAAAGRAGLRFVPEGFIDRAYADDGHLVNRAEKGAILQTDAARTAQALSLSLRKSVTTISGQNLTLCVQSLCLHSDSPGAAQTAKNVRSTLENNHVTIRAFA